jgi:hypothetical protein
MTLAPDVIEPSIGDCLQSSIVLEAIQKRLAEPYEVHGDSNRVGQGPML